MGRGSYSIYVPQATTDIGSSTNKVILGPVDIKEFTNVGIQIFNDSTAIGLLDTKVHVGYEISGVGVVYSTPSTFIFPGHFSNISPLSSVMANQLFVNAFSWMIVTGRVTQSSTSTFFSARVFGTKGRRS